MPHGRVVFDEILLSGATTDETTSSAIGPALLTQCDKVLMVVKFEDSSTAGVVQVESADSPDYAGAWLQEMERTHAGSGAPYIAAASVLTGPKLALRARITTAVNGGGVTVRLVGFKG